jgi:hypothetical protein
MGEAMIPNANTQDARRLLAGGIADLVQYLSALENPIIVGKQYPRNRLMKAINEWSMERRVSLGDADLNLWMAACKNGFMRKT